MRRSVPLNVLWLNAETVPRDLVLWYSVVSKFSGNTNMRKRLYALLSSFLLIALFNSAYAYDGQSNIVFETDASNDDIYFLEFDVDFITPESLPPNPSTVSIIRTSDNTVVDTVDVGESPQGVTLTPDGNFVYVTNTNSNNVSVIQTSDNTVFDTVDVGDAPYSVAVTPDGKFAYVVNVLSNNVSVIRTSDNTVVDTVDVGDQPGYIAITPDTDLDGVSNGNDADDDNDGIPDSMEKAPAQARSLNSTRDEIPGDIDGDGKPNERDLDSDGDGLPDHVEGGGNYDKNMDGIADNFLDADGDGHNDAHDPTQGGDVLTLPDTDGDGLPDFLDTDSDNDGISDTNETVGCVDADGDGKLDNSTDSNNDGLADSVNPVTGTPCGSIDSDGDGIFDHLDATDNSRGGSSSCSIAPPGDSNASLPVYLLIPAFILIARLWRRRTNRERT